MWSSRERAGDDLWNLEITSMVLRISFEFQTVYTENSLEKTDKFKNWTGYDWERHTNGKKRKTQKRMNFTRGNDDKQIDPIVSIFKKSCVHNHIHHENVGIKMWLRSLLVRAKCKSSQTTKMIRQTGEKDNKKGRQKHHYGSLHHYGGRNDDSKDCVEVDKAFPGVKRK